MQIVAFMQLIACGRHAPSLQNRPSLVQTARRWRNHAFVVLQHSKPCGATTLSHGQSVAVRRQVTLQCSSALVPKQWACLPPPGGVQVREAPSEKAGALSRTNRGAPWSPGQSWPTRQGQTAQCNLRTQGRRQMAGAAVDGLTQQNGACRMGPQRPAVADLVGQFNSLDQRCRCSSGFCRGAELSTL